MRVARQPARPAGDDVVERRAVELRVGHQLLDAGDQPVPQGGQPRRRAPARAATALVAATCEADDRGDVEGAGADVALLAPAVQQRRALGVAAQQQRAGAHRAAELVPGHGQRVHTAGAEVDRHLPDRLDRVGVQRDADGVRDLGQRRDVADRADLVVGPHDAGDRDVACRRRAPRRAPSG